MTVEQLVHEASSLPHEERTNLIDRLVMEFGRPDSCRTDDEWRVVARRRWDEIERGTAETISGDEVLAQAHRLVRQ